MRWEVRTMASGTSCFNSALYRKTLGRFWPLWTLWGVLWLLLLPLSQLSRYFDWVREGRSDSALVENFQEILSLQEVGVWLAALVGVLAAMAVGSVAVLMPWLLAFAAGAMMYVVVEEMIPEAASRAGTLGAMFGFLVMMALDVALG